MSVRRFGLRRAVRGGVVPSAVEVPESISDLKAWFDARSDSYFTLSGTSVTSWVSRAGSMGSVALSQATSANQPTRVTSALFDDKYVVQFDGSNDLIAGATAGDWSFIHNGTGCTIITGEYVDSTGGATQIVYSTMLALATTSGIYQHNAGTSYLMRVGNSSGTYLGSWSSTASALYVRDTARWRGWSYVDGTQSAYASGHSSSQADTAGQDPSASDPPYSFRLGAAGTGTAPLKGYVAFALLYSRVLTASELSTLGTWANQQYGVAA